MLPPARRRAMRVSGVLRAQRRAAGPGRKRADYISRGASRAPPAGGRRVRAAVECGRAGGAARWSCRRSSGSWVMAPLPRLWAGAACGPAGLCGSPAAAAWPPPPLAALCRLLFHSAPRGRRGGGGGAPLRGAFFHKEMPKASSSDALPSDSVGLVSFLPGW